MSQQTDFFLDKFGVGRLHQITTCFDKCKFQLNQSFHFRVTRIYDPTKFWIVVKFQELELFQKELFKYYYVNRRRYRIPEDKIELDSYCIAFIDSGYYRGLIVGFPCDLQRKPEVQIYFIDYGTIQTVEPQNIFYMSKMYAEVPQFVVRASLAGVCPKTSREWSTDDYIAFSEIVNEKVLIGVVVFVDDTKQVLEIRCSVDGTPVDEMLVRQKRARYWDEKPKYKPEQSPLIPKLKYQFLFPCHEALESGKNPPTIPDFDCMKEISPYSSIIARYYTEGE